MRFVIRCCVCGRKIGEDDSPDTGDDICDQCEDG